MIRSIGTATAILVSVSFSLLAQPSTPAEQRHDYALHLEARPAAPFPFLKKLGTVQVVVYPDGVRADSLWLDGFLLSGSRTVRIENPSMRLYTDASFDALRKVFDGLRPEDFEDVALGPLEVIDTGRTGTIAKLPVRCHRIVLGSDAWVDVWTTQTLRPSPAWNALQKELLSAISPELAKAAGAIPGVVVHVVLNTATHPKTTLLTPTEFYRSSAGREEALQTGRFFLRAPALDRLVK